jgi:hypothetical protein
MPEVCNIYLCITLTFYMQKSIFLGTFIWSYVCFFIFKKLCCYVKYNSWKVEDTRPQQHMVYHLVTKVCDLTNQPEWDGEFLKCLFFIMCILEGLCILTLMSLMFVASQYIRIRGFTVRVFGTVWLWPRLVSYQLSGHPDSLSEINYSWMQTSRGKTSEET